MIRNRSEENRQAINCLFSSTRLISPPISIVRQELDSMVRVIYLLSLNDPAERRRLIESTLRGEKWRIKTTKGRWKEVTDRDMVDLSQRLEGWTLSVYKFGCAFIHLSFYHNYLTEDPFNRLSDEEKHNIISHMRYYHGGPNHDNPDMFELASYLPQVFHKIADNLRCYLEELERE